MCLKIDVNTLELLGIPSLLGVIAGWCLSFVTAKIQEKKKSKKFLKTLLIEIEQNQTRLKEECKLDSYDSFKGKSGYSPGRHCNPDHKMEIYNSLLPQIGILPIDVASNVIDYYETLKDAVEKIKLYNNYLSSKESFKKEFFNQYCAGIKKAFEIGKKILSRSKQYK